MPISSSLAKEKIKSRMMKNAARLWGADETDIEVSFDPIVTMLIEGCVNEIEQLENEISDTQLRVINRLAELLTPDVVTSPKPAHAILFARPTEDQTTIQSELQFYIQKKTADPTNPSREISKDIFFSPLASSQLFDGSVKHFAFANRIFEIKQGFHKSPIAESERGRGIAQGDFWIGLEMSPSLDNLKNLCFYFDIRNNPRQAHFLSLLPHAKWFFQNTQIDTTSGWITAAEEYSLEREFDIDKRIEAEVNAIYNNHFIKIISEVGTNATLNAAKSFYPEKFTEIFSPPVLQQFKEELIWLKVEFPSGISNDLLNDVFCNINCFPVVNKHLNEFTFRLLPNLNIVPLNTKEYFFSIRSVRSSDNFEYTSNPLSKQRNFDSGTYILRHGGVQRFDSRNAQEILQYLLDLLRDESAAFTVLGNEFLTSQIKQFNQQLAFLEQKSGKAESTEEPTSYLMINPRQQGENVFVSFWSTDGEFANHIRPGNRMTFYSGGDVRSENIVFITSTKGGTNRLTGDARLIAFKNSLIARGRIVTPYDIKLFCHRELGIVLKEVSVSKGFTIGSDSRTGFVQTIDVSLTTSEQLKADSEEKKSICESLSEKLNQRSSSFIPIRVMMST